MTVVHELVSSTTHSAVREPPSAERLVDLDAPDAPMTKGCRASSAMEMRLSATAKRREKSSARCGSLSGGYWSGGG